MSSLTPSQTAATASVLCVDLDGTLIHTDLLWESFLSAVRRSPLVLLQVPFWLVKGRARLKRELAARADIDYASLPWNEEMLEWVRDEQRAGRRVVLATAADSRLAQEFAVHAAAFDEVFGTEADHNLKGPNKARLLRERYGESFDYAGDSGSDWAVWSVCRGIVAVGTSPALTAKLNATGRVVRMVPKQSAGLRDWLREIRLFQWAKNLLVLAPLLASHRATEPARLLPVLAAILSISLAASGTYLVNDLLDVTSDRRHPSKRHRPVAAGRIFIPVAILAAVLLLLAGFICAAVLVPRVLPLVILYTVASLSYSLSVKRIALVDVFFLSGLYTLRFFMGGVAAGVPLSGWFLSFSVFLFLSLGFAKRAAELKRAADSGIEKAHGRGYHAEDFLPVAMFGISSAFVGSLVLTQYLQSADVRRLYLAADLLWGVFPLPLYWLTRVWLMAFRGTLHEDPVSFALRDRLTWLLGAVAMVLLWLATTDPFHWASGIVR